MSEPYKVQETTATFLKTWPSDEEIVLYIVSIYRKEKIAYLFFFKSIAADMFEDLWDKSFSSSYKCKFLSPRTFLPAPSLLISFSSNLFP